MLQVLPYSKDRMDLSGRDYVISDMRVFNLLKPYLCRKLSGNWKLTFVRLELEQAEEIKDEFEERKDVEIIMYLKQEILDMFFSKNSHLQQTKVNSRELYRNMITNYPRELADNVVYSIYNRSGGNIERIREVLDALLEESGEITIKTLSKFLPYTEVIYPRDVIVCSLIKRNSKLRDLHPKTKYYKFKDSIELSKKLEIQSNKSYIFYAIRKFTRQLLDEKIKFLNNQSYTHEVFIENMSMHEIAFVYSIFELASPDMLYVNLYFLESAKLDLKKFAEIYLEQQDN